MFGRQVVAVLAVAGCMGWAMGAGRSDLRAAVVVGPSAGRPADVAEPTPLAPVGVIGGPVGAVAAEGDWVWFVHGGRLHGSHIGAPRDDWTAAPPGVEVQHMAAFGDLLAAGGPQGIALVDVGSGAPGRVVAALPESMSGSPFVLSGGHLVVARSGDLVVVDVRRPGSPRVVATRVIESAAGMAPPIPVASLAVDGSMLAVTTGATLLLFDVAGPAGPRFLGRYDDPGWRSLALRQVNGRTLAYGRNYGRLVGMDLTDPAAPVTLAAVDTRTWPNGWASAGLSIALRADGGPAIVTREWHGSWASAGVVLGLAADGTPTGVVWSSASLLDDLLLSAGEHLVVHGDGGLLAIGPRGRDLGGHASDAVDVATERDADGGRLYVNGQLDAVSVYRTQPSDPAGANLLSHVLGGGEKGGLTASDHVVCALDFGVLDLHYTHLECQDLADSDGATSFRAIEALDSVDALAQWSRSVWVASRGGTVNHVDHGPAGLREAATWRIPGGAADLDAGHGLLAAVGGSDRPEGGPSRAVLNLYELTRPSACEPHHAREVARWPIPGSEDRAAVSVAVGGGLAFVGTRPSNGAPEPGLVHVVDVHRAGSPRVVGEIRLPGIPGTLYWSGHLLVGMPEEILIYDVGVPSRPALAASLDAGIEVGPAVRPIAALDGVVYVAARRDGVLVFAPAIEWPAAATPTATPARPCPSPTPTPTATSRPTDTPTATPSPRTPRPTRTPTITSTPRPTWTRWPSATATRTGWTPTPDDPSLRLYLPLASRIGPNAEALTLRVAASWW